MVVRVVGICAAMVFGMLNYLLAQNHHQAEKTLPKTESLTTSAPAGKAAQRADPQIERLLAAMEGTWSITEELSPDSNSPNGKTGQGTIVWRPGPGGFSVIEEYRTRQGNEDVSGLGALWWDPVARGYHTIWCDSTNPGGCIDFKNVSRWEGQNLVLQEDYESNGKKYTFREVFGDIRPDEFTQTLYGAEIGKPLKVDQIIHAKRAKMVASS